MMDHGRQERELQEIFEATQQAYRTVMENTLALQERTLEFAGRLLENSAVRGQDESNRATLEDLAEQSKKQREAVEKLIRDATEDYTEVLKTPFSHHHQHHVGENVEASEAQEMSREPRST